MSQSATVLGEALKKPLYGSTRFSAIQSFTVRGSGGGSGANHDFLGVGLLAVVVVAAADFPVNIDLVPLYSFLGPDERPAIALDLFAFAVWVVRDDVFFVRLTSVRAELLLLLLPLDGSRLLTFQAPARPAPPANRRPIATTILADRRTFTAQTPGH